MKSETVKLKVATSPLAQYYRFEDVSWQQYESLLFALGEDFPALRLRYLSSILEITTTSPTQEKLRKTIGMLVESYLQETRTRFHAIGSATFCNATSQCGLEPDGCYCIGAIVRTVFCG